MTIAENQARYRWTMQLASTLEKAARLIEARPEGKALPLLPEAIARAYGLESGGLWVCQGRYFVKGVKEE